MLQEESRPEKDVLQKQLFPPNCSCPCEVSHDWIMVALIHAIYVVYWHCMNHTVIYIKDIRRRRIMTFIPK